MCNMGTNCHDCGVGKSELHILGCDDEVYPICKGQMITCDCILEEMQKTDAYNLLWEETLKKHERRPFL